MAAGWRVWGRTSVPQLRGLFGATFPNISRRYIPSRMSPLLRAQVRPSLRVVHSHLRHQPRLIRIHHSHVNQPGILTGPIQNPALRRGRRLYLGTHADRRLLPNRTSRLPQTAGTRWRQRRRRYAKRRAIIGVLNDQAILEYNRSRIGVPGGALTATRQPCSSKQDRAKAQRNGGKHERLLLRQVHQGRANLEQIPFDALPLPMDRL